MGESGFAKRVVLADDWSAFRAFLVGRAAVFVAILTALMIVREVGSTTSELVWLVSLVSVDLFLTLPYYLWGRRRRVNLRKLMLGVIFVEVFALTAGQYLLGEAAVYGILLYLILVAMAASLHSPNAAYVTAILGSIVYGMMVGAVSNGLLPPRQGPFAVPVEQAWHFTTVLFTALASLAMAVISSSLSNLARRSLFRSQGLEQELRGLNRVLEERILEAHADLRVKNEALERSLRQMELYASAISHDLRNPLTAAGESLRVATSGAPGSKERYLAIARDNLLRADQMLIGLRDLIRARGSQAPIVRTALRSLVESVFEDLLLVNRGEPIAFEIKGDLGEVGLDPERVTLVFRNLLANAIEHNADRDDLLIEVGVDRDADRCSFYVRDNGKGIPVDVQRRIFEPFREGLSRHPGGIGMGLALVETIVSDAGGEVWVESAAGAGATFCFTLPSVE